MNKFVPLLNNMKSNQIHNKILIKNQKPSINTFEGKNCCGATSYLLYHYLKMNNVNDNIKFMISTVGYGKYLEDHLYLLINDKYIIDPTYRQFLTDVDFNKDYFDLIFNYSHYIYYGEDIVGFYKKFQNLNNQLAKDNLLFWKNSKDVTQQYLSKDLNKILTNSKLKNELIEILNQKSFF